MLSYSFNPLHFGWQGNCGLTLKDNQKNLRLILCCKYTQLLKAETVLLCLDFGSYFDIRGGNTSRCIDIPLSVLSLLCIPKCSPSSLSLSFALSPLFLFSPMIIKFIITSQTEQHKTLCQNRHKQMLILIRKQTVITVDRGRMHWWNACVCACVHACLCALTVQCAHHHNQFVP